MTVSLRDLDALAHVNHAVYLSYIEVARTHYYFQRRGLRDIRDLDFVIAGVSCQYRSSAYLHETLVVSLAPSAVGRRSWSLRYHIRERTGGRLVADAETTLVQFDHAAGKVIDVPDDWRAILERDRAASLTP